MNKRFCDRCQEWVPERGLHPCRAKRNSEASKTKPTRAANEAKRSCDAIPSQEKSRQPVRARAKRKRESSTEQVRKWRKANPERATAYIRNYMRKWRSQQSEAE